MDDLGVYIYTPYYILIYYNKLPFKAPFGFHLSGNT